MTLVTYAWLLSQDRTLLVFGANWSSLPFCSHNISATQLRPLNLCYHSPGSMLNKTSTAGTLVAFNALSSHSALQHLAHPHPWADPGFCREGFRVLQGWLHPSLPAGLGVDCTVRAAVRDFF